ncbi:MAG: amidohydrolase family protein [Candidatus Gracilibacteria bacterium]|jgi:predicted TIM-barrel fold metal-dependent hydrolase
MKKLKNPPKWTTPLLGSVLLLILLFVAVQPQKMAVVNAHESIEGAAELEVLKNTMAKLGIEHTVLQGIPKGLLYFTDGVANLSEVEENNALLAEAVRENPEQFSYFCTIDPNDPLRLETLEACNEASGVKLYNGYSYAHTVPLDDYKLNTFYARLTELELPLMLPVSTNEYEAELRNMLTLNPELTVICPHFCLSSKNLPRLRALMEDFPNLYIDTSFGHIDFAQEGFKTLLENKEAYRAFFEEFQDRIVFGTDAVLSSYEGKDEEWVTDLYKDYLSTLRDLDLTPSVQRKILSGNWNSLTR